MTAGVRYAFKLLAGLIPLGFGAALAHAGDWQIQPRFSLSETYTDNALLEGDNPSSDLITTLSPGVSISGNGARVRLATQYTAQKQIFKNNDELGQLTHLLQTNGNAELVRDQVFMSAFASMFPTVRDSFGQISNRNRNARDASNRTNVVSYGFAPEFRHRLGNWVSLKATTNWSDVSTGEGQAGGGQNMDWRFSADSGRRFARVSWGSNFSRRENDGGDFGNRSVFQQWTNTARYRLNRFVRLNSTLGYESNDFQTDQNGLNGQGNLRGGLNWSLGTTLNLTPRTSITGSFGERAFGSTKSFDFNHRWRRFIVNGRYNEELRTTAEVLREQQVFGTVDPFGNPIIDPLGNGDPSVPIDQLGLTNDVFISRTFIATVGYQLRRDQFNVNVTRRSQESTLNGNADTLFSTGGSWSHTLSNRLSTGLTADFQTREGDGLAQTSDFMFISPFVNYTIGPRVSSRLSYSHMDSVSGDASDDFTENAVQGTLSFAF